MGGKFKNLIITYNFITENHNLLHTRLDNDFSYKGGGAGLRPTGEHVFFKSLKCVDVIG